MSNAITMDFWRQLGIVSPDRLTFPITIIGAGGIGSPTALLLAKMGCSDLTVWDFDTVDLHNFPNQFYRTQDYGRLKVQALSEIIQEFTGTTIKVREDRYEGQPLEGVVIAAPDNMSTRELIWKSVRLKMSVPLLIDARMGGQEGQIYVVNPRNATQIKAYESSLHTDDEALDEACTETAIIYNVYVIAGLIGALIKCHANQEEFPIEGILRVVDMRSLLLL